MLETDLPKGRSRAEPSQLNNFPRLERLWEITHSLANEVAVDGIMTDTGETALTQGHESHCHHGSDYVWVADENLVPDNDQSPILQNFPMGD